MSTNPLYNLTWGEYGTSLISAVQLLRCHDELVDVTLAAGGRTFHAHKVVLCAASPFLLDLLKSTTCKHPVVMLAGVQATDLEALLEFVYRGEVSVDPNQLPSLLQAAHCLNIQGLAPSPTISNDPIQHSPKADVSKAQVQEIIQAQSQIHISQDEEIPLKRKRRAKRLRSPTVAAQTQKWSKVYIQTEGNGSVLVDAQQDNSAPAWAQQMNLVNVSTSTSTLESLPIQTPILVQNIPVSVNTTNSSTPKIRGASDQPGACPLCGAMLRQARNLRRHLLTSCKYRMVNGQQNTISSMPQQMERTPDGTLHQLQTIGIQNIERVGQNVERIDSKPIALTPISCSDLLPSNSNIITMQSGSLQ